MAKRSKPKNSPGRPLYLRRLQVQNARCFKDIDVDFMRKRSPRMRTIIVGDNGSGKTSLLRAIAIGMCQQREASALMSDLAGDFVRRNKRGNYADRAVIDLSFLDPNDPGAELRITTEVERGAAGQETVHTRTTPDAFPWHRVFVGGYGVNRGARHREVRQGYARVDALRSLFSDDTPLLDPEGTLRAIKLADTESGRDTLLPATKSHLRHLLRLKSSYEIEVSAREVLIHGPWGAMPFHALGDGYRGTAGWVLDLLGMALAADRLDDIKAVRGVVLIDEIDEHLHPAWQRQVLPLLSKRFKDLQIVGTTHSAMTIVECEADELIACRLKNAVADTYQNLPDPEGRSADDILRGEWFGLASTLDERTQKLMQQYQRAIEAGKGETVVAPLREKLRDRLGRTFDSPIDELAIEIAAELRKQNRGAVSPDERRAVVEKGVQALRARLAAHASKRGKK
ncbi:AAA family ATPase [Haliangium sp.]|uniref:AAA family ATPase n=1 Tax=Haliangium sp. TaxID=2663208 RepID=UPI003D09BD9B